MAAATNFFVPHAEKSFVCVPSMYRMPGLKRWGKAELLSRKAEQYEETLRVMYQRVTETRPHEEALRSDVEKLVNTLRRVMERLENLYCDNNEESEYELDSAAGLNAGNNAPKTGGEKCVEKKKKKDLL